MKIYSFLIAVLISIPTTAKSLAAEPDKQLHNKCLYPTVLIKGGDHGGTGFIVRSDFIKNGVYHNVAVTCGHIISDHTSYTVNIANYTNWSSFNGYTTYPARVYCKNKDMDLAVLLFISKEKLPVVELAFHEKLYIGNEIFRIGCGLLDEPRLDYGKITSLKTTVNEHIKDVARTSVHTIFGDSGSPVFYDYRVIGITQAIRSVKSFPLTGISYFIPIERLKNWNKSENNGLNFIYTNKKLPVLPFLQLKLESQVIKEDE